MKTKTFRAISNVILTLALLVTIIPAQALTAAGPPEWALSNRPASAPPLTVPAFDELQLKMREEGKVQVIVRLRDDTQMPQKFTAEGKLTNVQAQEAQRAAIARVQDVILNRLPPQSAAKSKRFEYIPFMALEVDQSGFDDLLNSPEIDLVEMDVPVPPSLTESIPLIGGDGSGLFSGFSGAGQAVAILDTGVQSSHPFFTGRVVEEACYSTTVGGQSSSVCPNGQNQQIGTGSGSNCSSSIAGCDHGTHVAGIAAGNGGSMTGVAMDADIIAIQVFANFGGTAMSWSSDQLKALERVYSLRDTYNIAAVNMSLGGGSYSSNCDATNASLKAAIDTLRSVGIATVIATGNNGYTNSINAPSCISSAISVGSTSKSDTVASYSNSSSLVDLLAPGSLINASIPGSSYAYKSGTSMATPHVTGAWAVMKSKKPTATVDDILNAFEMTGQSITDSRNGIVKPRTQLDAALSVLSASSVSLTPSVASPQEVGSQVTFTAAGSAGSGSYEYEFYLKAPGSSTWVQTQAYSNDGTWAWETAGLVAGTYSVKVWLKDAGTSPAVGYDTFRVVGFTLIPLPASTGVSLTPSIASPQSLGTSITFTAAGAGGTGSYEYAFYLKAPGGSWVKKQDYGSTATWAWNTSGLAAGAYQVCVWAKSANSSPATGYDTLKILTYELKSLLLTLTPSVVSPQNVATSITFTAGGAGGSGSFEYEYYILPPGGNWTKARAYSSTATWTWDTAGLVAGDYQVCVWIKNAGTSPASGYDSYQIVNYTLSTLPAATATSLTPDSASPQVVGQSITFTAAGAGGTGSYEYAFYLKAPGGSWVKKQDYGSAATWAWNTSGLAAGAYQVCVWAKSANSSPAKGYDTLKILTYELKSLLLTLTPSVVSPQNVATSITFTTAGAGGSGSFEYEYYILPPGGSWTKARAYSSTATWTWDTAGLVAGDYQACVWIKNAGTSPASGYDSYQVVNYTLSTLPAATATSLAPDSASPQVVGQSITFTAAGAGGTGSYEYAFYLKAPGGSWVKKQDYGSAATWAWNTSGLAAGAYQVCVWAKSANSSPAKGYDTLKILTYELKSLLLTLTPSVVSPQNVATSITFTAAGAGGSGSFEYEYYILPPGGSWTKARAYSSTATWTWDTAGLVAGDYQACVWIKNAGTSPASGYDSYQVVNYTLSTLPAATATSLAPDSASPQVVGQSITFTAAGAGGTGSYEYAFYLKAPGGSWVKRQDYGSTATWAWNTSGLAAGAYQVCVWAKSANSSPATGYDTFRILTYELK